LRARDPDQSYLLGRPVAVWSVVVIARLSSGDRCQFLLRTDYRFPCYRLDFGIAVDSFWHFFMCCFSLLRLVLLGWVMDRDCSSLGRFLSRDYFHFP